MASRVRVLSGHWAWGVVVENRKLDNALVNADPAFAVSGARTAIMAIMQARLDDERVDLCGKATRCETAARIRAQPRGAAGFSCNFRRCRRRGCLACRRPRRPCRGRQPRAALRSPLWPSGDCARAANRRPCGPSRQKQRRAGRRRRARPPPRRASPARRRALRSSCTVERVPAPSGDVQPNRGRGSLARRQPRRPGSDWQSSAHLRCGVWP